MHFVLFSCFLGVLSLSDIYQHIMDENGRNVVVIHLSKSINYLEYFIVVTANSTRHLAVSNPT